MWHAARTGSPEVLRVSECSPDTAETSFRELDDVFLQTQTRIWLGEVLHVRFDEDVAISDMLADGELLFQVSKEVWKMLLRKYGELKHSKVHIYERTSSGKSDGRYMPYPKVDSFLKICQILGLTGVDLFCPSDVVEKRDTRRVCMCIRSLSKKARLKKLNVPDFDIVTYTIAMPTNLVGGIRRNLELSQCSSPSSNGSSPRIDSREICGQKILCGQYSQHYDLGSDEAESIFSDLEFQSPLPSSSYNATSISYLVGETSDAAASVAEEIVPETGFNNTRQNGNHYEHVDRHHEESSFSEAIGSYNLSTREAYTFHISSSSSISLQNTDQDARTCFSDIGKRCSLLSNSRNHLEKFDDDCDFLPSESEICKESVDSNQKNAKSGLKVEGMVDAVASGTSYQADVGATSLNVAPLEHYHHSQFSVPFTISYLEVHNNVEVEPCNNSPETSASEDALSTNNKSTKNTSYCKETSDHSISVTPNNYNLDTETDRNDGNLPDEFKSPSILNPYSLYQSICASESEESCCSMVSRDPYSLSFSLQDNQNDYPGSLGGPLLEKNQMEMANAGSSAENGHALLGQHDESCYPAERKSEYYCTDHLMSSYSTENICECSTFSSMYSMCNNENGQDGTNLVANNNMPENDVSTSNFKMDSNEALINAKVPVLQKNVNAAAYSLSLEERKICNNATFSNFEIQDMSRNLNSGSEVGLKTDYTKQTDISYHPSCQTQKVLLVDLKENLSEEPCVHENLCRQDSVSQNILNISSSDTQGEDLGRICGSMLEERSISDIPCMVSMISDQQRSPKKDETVGHFNVPGMPSINGFDCSDQVKKHQSSADASDNKSLLSIHESKIPPDKPSLGMKIAVKESLVYLEPCHFGDDKMSDVRNQMINKLNSFHARDLGVLDVMKSSDILACNACASEVVPSFDFYSLDLVTSGKHGLETKVETFKTADISPCSTLACREERTGSQSIREEKQVVCCILDAHEYTKNPEPPMAPQLKAKSEYEKEIIKPEEEGENKNSEGRVVGKPGNQVLKSVAGAVAMVGALVLVLHLWQKRNKERDYGTEVPLQTQKLSTYKKQIRMGNPDSLYPGEKLKL